jgi:hypothetical protein
MGMLRDLIEAKKSAVGFYREVGAGWFWLAVAWFAVALAGMFLGSR